MRILVLVILLTTVIFSQLNCKKNDQEMIQYLENLIEQGELNEASKIINELLSKTNNLLSLPVNVESTTKNLVTSLDGRIAAWSVADDFYFFTGAKDQVESRDLDGPIEKFMLSHSGKMSAILYKYKNNCRLTIVDIINDSEIEPDIGEVECNEQILISDDGKYIYRYKNKQIIASSIHKKKNDNLNLGEDQIARRSIPQSINEKKFKIKYKKIKQKMVLYQINQRGWVSFFGAGGSYKLKYYPGSADKTLTIKSLFAKPVFYPVFEGDTLTHDSDSPIIFQKASEQYLFDEAHAFAYSGGAGKRKLRALVFGVGIKSGKGFVAPIWDQMQFIRDREEFMVRKNEQLYYWNPVTNKKIRLPLLARQFFLFKGGLLYLDLTKKLYIRKKPFTDMEINLVKLRQKVDQKNTSIKK